MQQLQLSTAQPHNDPHLEDVDEATNRPAMTLVEAHRLPSSRHVRTITPNVMIPTEDNVFPTRDYRPPATLIACESLGDPQSYKEASPKATE